MSKLKKCINRHIILTRS